MNIYSYMNPEIEDIINVSNYKYANTEIGFKKTDNKYTIVICSNSQNSKNQNWTESNYEYINTNLSTLPRIKIFNKLIELGGQKVKINKQVRIRYNKNNNKIKDYIDSLIIMYKL